MNGALQRPADAITNPATKMVSLQLFAARTLKIYVDGSTGEHTLTEHQRWVWDCVFSVDGVFLVTAS